MAIDDLPSPVVSFLNAVGVPWPYVNEDTVLRFAALVREFGRAVERTHEDATGAVESIARGYTGAATRQLRSGWAELSGRHVTQIVAGCEALAVALEGAAGYLVAQKAAAVADLAGMAAAFAADQAAAVATFGVAEAAAPVIVAGAQRLVDSLVLDLEQYVVGEVVDAALKPLVGWIAAALAGLDWTRTTPSGGPGAGFALAEQEVRAATAALRTHAQELRSHTAVFKAAVAGLGF